MLDIGELGAKILVFGGPYSNLAATEAMRIRALELDIAPDHIICSGDLVAYCAEPAETVDLIKAWGIHVVMGNCEASLAFGEVDCGCGFEPSSNCSTLALTWYQYADQRIHTAHRRWMKNLPDGIEFQVAKTRFRVVHGSPDSINAFVFASSDTAIKRAQTEQANVDAIIGGHSGIPFGQRIENRLWLNAGVIGMPANDGGNHGWYMLIEAECEKLSVSWHKLDYDFHTSSRTTMAAGMVEYGQALVDGIWPSMDVLPESERQQSGQALCLPALRYP